MPITPTAERTGPYSVKYTWSGTAPYYVWQDGALILSATTATQYVAQTIDASTNPLPAIEVLDANDAGLAESAEFCPRLRIQWRGQTDAAVYLVQEYVVDTWTTRANVVENGTGYYSLETPALDDGTTAEWRVLPRDANGYEGEPVAVQHFVVRNPAPPAVTFSYDAGTGLLTVEAA